MRTVLRGYLIATMILAFPPPASSSTSFERVAERGPATFVVGTSFVLLSLVSWPAGAVTGADTRIHQCRLSHGAKMTAAGIVLLPVGLVAAPFHPAGAATGFADSLAEAFQEDTCSRPTDTILP